MIRKRMLFLAMVMLLCTPALAQELPRIAVYVTGGVPENEKTALGTRMLASLINSGRYMGIERSAAFLAEIEREQVTQRSGAIDDSHISELGRQFGVKYVCIAAITPAFGSYQVSARIVDVETAVVVFIGDAASPLKTMDDLTRVSERIVGNMFGRQSGRQASQPAQRPEAAPKPPRTPIKPTFWAGIGLEALGAGLLAYGIIENGNVGAYTNKDEHDKVVNSAKNRNIAYGIGAAVLLGGVSVHIFF